MKTTKWLIYTVLVGATPFLIRLLIYLFATKLKSDYIFNEVDMVTFGLVLHVSNINELEDRIDMIPKVRSTYIGLSTIFIVLFSVCLGIAYIADFDKGNLFDKHQIKTVTGIFSLLSLFLAILFITRKGRLNKMAELIKLLIWVVTIVVSFTTIYLSVQNLRHNRRRSYDEYIRERDQRHKKD